jgi:hypothetical protein
MMPTPIFSSTMTRFVLNGVAALNPPLKTTVVFLIFNRPDKTKRVFEEIRRARPPKLLVIADGPRPDRPQDAAQCVAARAIIEQVDWPCNVQKNYSDANLGCRRRIASGLDWVFQTVEEAIILEDDCLPHQTFFRFCEELLEKYRSDERIMQISGDNFQFGRTYGKASYYFSRYPHVWGWATWRRAWQYYDVDLKEWLALKNKDEVLKRFSCRLESRFWKAVWDDVAMGKIDTWDYQWSFACMAHNGLAIMPNVNLVSNIGYGHDGTHTIAQSKIANLPVVRMEFPLIHPWLRLPDARADKQISKLFFRMPSLASRASQRIRRRVRGCRRACQSFRRKA